MNQRRIRLLLALAALLLSTVACRYEAYGWHSMDEITDWAAEAVTESHELYP